MKLLTLIRHAKSSWKEPGVEDFDRTLNKRGERDAPRMGERLAATGEQPDLIVSSSARRAERTARLIAEQLGIDPADVVLGAELYLAPPARMLDVVRALDPGLEHVALVGHNPGITDFLNQLSDVTVDDMPTCAIARLRLDVERWGDAEPGCAHLLDFDYPKRER